MLQHDNFEGKCWFYLSNNNLLQLYSTFLALKSPLQRRGSLLNHHQCAAST